MPAWYTHLVTAYEVEKRIEINDKDTFFLGNMMPDAERYVVSDFSFDVPWKVSHFGEKVKYNGGLVDLYNIDKFVNEYKNDLENPIVIGYLTHLLTDEFWNRLVFKNINLYDEHGDFLGLKLNNNTIKKCDKEEGKVIKHRDFKKIQEYLKANKKYCIPEYNDKMLYYARDIKEILYTKDNILKILKYLKDNSSIQKIDYDYELFLENQIELYFKNSIDYITTYLQGVGIKIKATNDLQQ